MKNSVNSVNHQFETNSSLSSSVPVYPLPPHRGQSSGKLAAFLAGVITGAAGLVAAVCLTDRFETTKEERQNFVCSDDDDRNVLIS